MSDFFADAPWLNVPPERLALIVEHSPRVRGGLPGGSSQGQNAPKSKLAALAAARKKENQNLKKDADNSGTGSILDRLQRSSINSSPTNSQSLDGTSDVQKLNFTRPQNVKKYSGRKRKQSLSPARQPKPQEAESSHDSMHIDEPLPEPRVVPKGSPSIFADVILGSTISSSHRTESPLISHYMQTMKELPADLQGFTGPSPDDKVLKAQSSSKGSKGGM